MNQAVALRSLRSLNRLTTLRAVHTSRVVLAPKRASPKLNDHEHRERMMTKSQQRAEAMYALAAVSQKMETQTHTREEFRNNLKELESVLEPYIKLYAEKYSGMEGDGEPLDDGTQPYRKKLEEVRSTLAELDRQDRGH